jgi:hypothetical protein
VEPVNTVEERPPVAVGSLVGQLTVDWSINGTRDPNQCSQGAAAAIEITVTNSAGLPAGRYQQSCNTFSTSITLDAGTYSAAAYLVDAAGTPRTTTIQINPFTLRGNDNLQTPIEFSADSFF